jgi:hypothetical protein
MLSPPPSSSCALPPIVRHVHRCSRRGMFHHRAISDVDRGGGRVRISIMWRTSCLRGLCEARRAFLRLMRGRQVGGERAIQDSLNHIHSWCRASARLAPCALLWEHDDAHGASKPEPCSTQPTHIVLITFPHRLIIRMTKCFVDRTIEEEHVAISFMMFYVV